MIKNLLYLFTICLLILGANTMVKAQGATTASMSGVVNETSGETVPGVTVVAVHQPSGTQYGTVTQSDGRYRIIGMRIGGPYRLTFSFVGYGEQVSEGIFLTLGNATNIDVTLSEESTQLDEVEVIARQDDAFNSERTGATTNVSSEGINALPTISRQISDFTRLTPQASGNSIAGQDSRLNNITLDGSFFNNSFGLGNQPGNRTGVSPVSLDAIDQIQVAIAPYDVRQGNFVGANINTVTRSGTNEFTGSAYYLFRNEGFIGTDAAGLEFDPGEFNYAQYGVRLGGPIIKDKLFFFVSTEIERQTTPATTFRANRGNEPAEGNVTRVLASDLDQLSTFLRDNFDYETGPYEGYDFGTNADKLLVKLDYNISQRHKFSLRYNFLLSDTDVLASNSSSLGFGGRRTNINALNFANSNYRIQENIHSVVGELNSTLGSKMQNNVIIGYTYQNEDRAPVGQFFPLVDILEDGNTYTTFGFEPFSPNNSLQYSTFQLQENFTYFSGAHTITAGLNLQYYESTNIFFPGAQSAYVYNSLDDFYADAEGYLANPNRTTSPVELNRFQVRYSAQPGLSEPVQPLEVLYGGLYIQDEWSPFNNLNLTMGLRVDVPFFGETGFNNPEVDALDFLDENDGVARYSTEKMPDANPLWSPRFGFNWNVNGDGTLQVRGGTGVFTGTPAYVWISNQVGNNGVLTGFIQGDNTVDYPFNPDPDTYKPVVTEVQVAPSYELAVTDPDFKFPQVWRTNIAVDKSLPFGMVGTAEFIYNRDVNGIYYINANLPVPEQQFSGADDRSLYTANRIHSQIPNNIVLKNQNSGYAYSLTASLEKPFTSGFFAKAAYTFGVAKNTIDPGSIASGSWFNNPIVDDPNMPDISFSSNDQRHRTFVTGSYRKEYAGFGATQVSLFWEGRNVGRANYTFSGDLNGDGGNGNDLIYIPSDRSEMNFEEYTSSGGTLFTAEEQEEAWEAYIQQDEYLSDNRGSYVERNGIVLPWVFRADLSLIQEFFIYAGNKRNTLQLRADILNVGNLISSNWGAGQRLVTSQPLVARGVDGQGQALYRLQNFNDELVSESFQGTNNLADVYQIQLGIRYIFGN